MNPIWSRATPRLACIARGTLAAPRLAVRVLAIALAVLTGCTDDRAWWYPVYPLPDETAIAPGRPFAIAAFGMYPDSPCDEPERLPSATVIDLDRRTSIAVNTKCAPGYLYMQPAEPLFGDTNYRLQLSLDPEDLWKHPIYSATARVDDTRVTAAFSTASRPAAISAHWSGWDTDADGTKTYTAYVMFSQALSNELHVELETDGQWQAVGWFYEKQWFANCDRLNTWCRHDDWGRQHIVRAYTPRHGRLRVSGVAADGTRFGPQLVDPVD
ncbi:MAG TPA: hypothetical protein VIV11_11900 [Kofleriaceae bacterium]